MHVENGLKTSTCLLSDLSLSFTDQILPWTASAKPLTANLINSQPSLAKARNSVRIRISATSLRQLQEVQTGHFQACTPWGVASRYSTYNETVRIWSMQYNDRHLQTESKKQCRELGPLLSGTHKYCWTSQRHTTKTNCSSGTTQHRDKQQGICNTAVELFESHHKNCLWQWY